MAFSQNGPRAVCVLSANGAISNVTLSQAATSGGTATYEVLDFCVCSFLLVPLCLIMITNLIFGGVNESKICQSF